MLKRLWKLVFPIVFDWIGFHMVFITTIKFYWKMGWSWEQFHDYFIAGIDELKLSDIILVEQQEEESAMEYIERFRNIHSQCYSLSLSDEQLADLAFQGLSAPIRDRFFCPNFDSLAHLMQIVSAHESRLEETKEYQFWSYQDQKEDNFEAWVLILQNFGACVNVKIW